MSVITTPRLVRVDLYRHPEGGVLLGTPRGRMLRVRMPAEEVRSLLQACDGERTLHDLASRYSLDGELLRLVDVLHQEGCLAEADPSPDEGDHVRLADGAGRPRVTPDSVDLVVLGSLRLVERIPVGRFRSLRRLPSMAALANVDPDASVVVLLLDRLDQGAMLNVNRRCRETGLRWTHFHFERESGWFGPHVDPAGGPDAEDLLARRRAAAGDPFLLDALDAPMISRNPYLPPASELDWLLHTLVADLEHWVSGTTSRGIWNEVELDPLRLAVRTHPVLPLPNAPDRARGGPEGQPADERVVDDRTGIIRRLTDVDHHPSIPRSLTTVHARVADISRVTGWRCDSVAGGSTFGDRQSAAYAAVGEGIERYCGNIIRADLLTRGSYAELVARGERAVDPDSLVMFSNEQYDSPGFPFTRFTRDLPVHWVRGRSLVDSEPAWLPASLVYANWHRQPPASGPPTNGTFFPGIACGRSLGEAVTAGLLEVVERHATMVWWLSAQPLPAARLSPDLRFLWTSEPGDGGLRFWLIPLENEFSIPVMAGCVEHADDQLLTVGFAARPDPAEAARKAWAEALTLQEIARDLDIEDGPYRRAARLNRFVADSLKEWRRDRDYLDLYRPDFRDVVDLVCQMQVHLDPRARDLIRPWIDPDTEIDVDFDRVDERDVVEAVLAGGYDVYYADITTPDVDAVGLKVARTLVPGLVPNSAAAFPFLGRNVVRQAAVELGWRSTPLAEHSLNRVPMPHA